MVFSGDCSDDWRVPTVVTRGQRQQRLQLFLRSVNAFFISLVDHEDVANLHDSGFDGLNVVTHSRYQDHHGNIRGFDDFDFVLTHAYSFNDDLRIAGRIENRYRVDSRSGQAAEIAACGHRANENAFVQPKRLHSYPVAENRAPGKRARRIDCNYPDSIPTLAIEQRELIHQRRLAGAGRTRDTDNERASRTLINLLHQRRRAGRAILDLRDGARHRGRLAPAHAFAEIVRWRWHSQSCDNVSRKGAKFTQRRQEGL